jgi:hypothetical protein
MRVRNTWIAVTVVAAASLSSLPAALAQGSAPAPAVQKAPVASTANIASVSVRPATVALPAERRIFAPPSTPAPTPPTVLGEAWTRKLRAALEGVQHALDEEALPMGALPPNPRAEALEALRVTHTKEVVSRVRATPPVVPAWRAAWTPATALREAIAQSPVQVTPVSVAPPSESTVDTRGEHATLLGVRVELPWMVP